MDALTLTLAATVAAWLSALAAADARRLRRAAPAPAPPPADGHRFGRAGRCRCGVSAGYYHAELFRAELPCPLALPPESR